MAIWAKAGLTTPPTTPTEFLNDLKAIKAKTSAIPYYTNYKNQWPLSKWQGEIGLNGNANANNDLAASTAPWTPGQPQYILDSLLFNIVQGKLSEPDPLTTDFAVSKTLIGSGKVATMLLGSWAVPQMQQAAVDAGGRARDIGFLPFPYQVNGKFYSVISSDYLLGINKYSKNMATAKAWVTWFSNKSGYAASTGSISPLLGGKNPSTLADFTKDGVQYVELNPAPKGQEALLSDIANTSHIDLNGYVYRQKLVDIARGAVGGTMQSYFDQLNTQWAAAKKTVK